MGSPKSVRVCSGRTTVTVLSAVGDSRSPEEAVPASSTGLRKALLEQVTLNFSARSVSL